MNEQLEQLDKEYVLHTYARNYVNFKKGINATLFDDKNKDAMILMMCDWADCLRVRVADEMPDGDDNRRYKKTEATAGLHSPVANCISHSKCNYWFRPISYLLFLLCS